MKRIVSICPSNTELLYFLGVGDQVVGLDDYSDWPIEWDHLPRLGSDLDIDMEKVKKLKPDLVVASLSVPGMEKNIERLQQEQIPHLVLNPKTLDEIATDLIRLGSALEIESHAEQVAQAYLQELNFIQAHIPPSSTPSRLYWEWWPKPVFTPGKKNWLTDVSHLVGAINIFAEVDQESVQTDWEEVAKRRPDFVLVAWTGIPIHRVKKELITSRPAWKDQLFAQEDRIFILEEGWYCRPSPRILTGIKYLAHLLYPDHFLAPHPDDPFANTIKK